MKHLMMKVIRGGLQQIGYDLLPYKRRKTSYENIPDFKFYAPVFSPWLGYGEFGFTYEDIADYTAVSPDRCWVLYVLASQAISLNGDFCECGVYRGGTAMLLEKILMKFSMENRKKLHLFDTFEGMPATDSSVDLHKKGDFADTSMEAVRERLISDDMVEFHKGWIPDTFVDLRQDSRFSLVHIDVDIYRSVIDCCNFLYERIERGGFMVFDDYGFPSCPGARKAVDEFFASKPEKPLSLPTGQAVVFKI